MQNFISTETSSQTAMACEQAALFGATPGPDEFDNREIWNEEEALAGIEEAIHILAGAVAPDGTQLADERESLLWGFVNTLHAQVQRLDRGIDKIAPEMKDLGQEQDGSEIKSRELERLTDRVQNLGDRRDAFEAMRDLAAEGYRTETGDTWRPRNGSHSSQTGKLTSAAIDARDYLRARKDRETSAHLPEGTLVAFTGGKDFGDVTAIWRSLDSIKIKYDDMVLLHGGGPGAEKIAASWAEKNGVHQVVCKPNWDRDGKAAPFRRNDVLLNFLPKGLVAFPALASRTTCRQGTQDRNPRPSRRRITAPFRVGPRHHTAEVGPFFMPVCIKSRPMAGRFAPPPIVRAYARWRLLVLRTMHRRLSARRFAPSPYAGAEAPRWRPAIPHCNFIIRIPKTAMTDEPLLCATSFGSERIFAFFRHHGPGGLGNLPSRQHALVQKRPQTALRDIDAARFQHLMHLSHRHPLRLLLDQPLPQTVQHIRQAQLRRHKFRQLAVYGIEVDIRFVEAFRRHIPSLSAISGFVIRPRCIRRLSDHRSEEREPWQSETPAMMVRALA